MYPSFIKTVLIGLVVEQVCSELLMIKFRPSVSRSDPEFSSHFQRLEYKMNSTPNTRSVNNDFNLRKFTKVFKGYSGDFSPEVISWIKAQPEVEAIEKDFVVKPTDVQLDAPWGLTRITQRVKLNDTNSGKYSYPSGSGKGVRVYVIDTGINIDHVEFGGRAIWGKTFARNSTNTDSRGHGTHVAATIGGTKYGVSKNVELVALKVVRDSGSGSGFDTIDAIEWSTLDTKVPNHKKVINMSLGSWHSDFFDEAVNNAVDLGITIVAAAGNQSDDACAYSPGSATKAITVAATDVDDKIYTRTNKGRCVDIFAPGVNVLSAWIGSNNATFYNSGTSMASPHVAGVVAEMLSTSSTPLTPDQVISKLLKEASRDVVVNPPANTTNLMVYK